MIGIVGAGISGLALASSLRRRGVEVVVLEAGARVGGVIRSSDVEGRVLEHGPQRMRLTPAVASLVREAGLEPRLVRAPEGLPLYVFRDRRLRPVPFGLLELLRSDLLSVLGRARVLGEPLTRGLRENETAGAYFRRKVGVEAYRALVGPLFGGLYGSDPDEMWARHALREILDATGVRRSLLLRTLASGGRKDGAVPAVSFEEGMEELPRALARELGDAVRVSAPARAVAPRGAGWTIVTEGEEWGVERVVLTTPAPATAGLVEAWGPELAATLRSLRYNDLVLVHLVGNCGLSGWGYQVAFGEDLRTRGVTWNASLFGRNGVHTAFLGGASDPEVPGWDDDRVAEAARAEFRVVTGCDARPVRVVRTRIPAWDRSWAALDRLPSLPGGLHFFANWRSRVGIPARIREARALAEELAPAGSSRPGPRARV